MMDSSGFSNIEKSRWAIYVVADMESYFNPDYEYQEVLRNQWYWWCQDRNISAMPDKIYTADMREVKEI